MYNIGKGGIKMKKGFINAPDEECCAVTYSIRIEYEDGEVYEDIINQYSYSDVFEVIKDNHQDERDKSVKSIKIDLINYLERR